MISINIKYNVGKSKKENCKIQIRIEKKSIMLDTSIAIPYLIIKKTDWISKNETIRNLGIYKKERETLNKIKEDIDTYLSNTTNYNKENILLNIKKILLKNDIRKLQPSYSDRILSEFLNENVNKITNKARATINNYKSNIKKLESYETHFNNTNNCLLKIGNLDCDFIQNFVDYLAEFELYYNSKPVINSIKGLTEVVFKNNSELKNIFKNDYVVVDNPNIDNDFIIEELPYDINIFNELFNLKNLNKSLETTRQWIIIGCYTGLRVEDLLEKFCSNMMINRDKNYITFIPEKTKKINDNKVLIPIWGDLKKYFINNNYHLPLKQCKTEFGNNLKELYKLVDSESVVKTGKTILTTLKNGKKKRRKVFNEYFVWDCFSAHDLRRFFVTTMLEKELLTPNEIMLITGHKNLKTLLIYDKRNTTAKAKKLVAKLEGKSLLN